VRLANATIGTYVQSQGKAQFDCFSCQQSNGLGTSGGLSHGYGNLQLLKIEESLAKPQDAWGLR
jgi:hypothetical protein